MTVTEQFMTEILMRLRAIEDHVSHIRYGEGNAYASAMSLQWEQQGKLSQGNQAIASKPAPASPADPQAQRTDHA